MLAVVAVRLVTDAPAAVTLPAALILLVAEKLVDAVVPVTVRPFSVPTFVMFDWLPAEAEILPLKVAASTVPVTDRLPSPFRLVMLAVVAVRLVTDAPAA